MRRLAPSSGSVESLDFVGPNPPSLTREGTIPVFPAKAGIYPANHAWRPLDDLLRALALSHA